jgi:hypothetical protein
MVGSPLWQVVVSFGVVLVLCEVVRAAIGVNASGYPAYRVRKFDIHRATIMVEADSIKR